MRGVNGGKSIGRLLGQPAKVYIISPSSPQSSDYLVFRDEGREEKP